MKPVLHIVELDKAPILRQLQWEEALLRADHRNWCLINRGSSPAIVMGISGNIPQLIDTEKLQLEPIPLIRRFSGGGTVVVDEDTLFITFICQTADVAIPPFPRHVMQWTAELYRPLFPNSFALLDNDYVLDEKKWGGNAQSIIKGRWLHHSSLLWDFKPYLMEYLTIPAKAPQYRKGRSHCDFLCRLREQFPKVEDLHTQLFQQLRRQFELKHENLAAVEKIEMLPHRKSTVRIE